MPIRFLKRASLTLPNDIPITVERTGRRRTASIQVNNGRVRVLVPRHLPDREIRDLIARKMDWIEKTIQVHAGMAPAVQRNYVDGEIFTYLGKRYQLRVARDTRDTRDTRIGERAVSLTRGCLHVDLREDEDRASIRDRLVDWYASHALARLEQRTRDFAKELGVRPRSVAVKAYRGRWGSCTSDGRITYNWKIIVAPPQIVDYVVVHELCHLLELNHSPAYWDLVRRVMPDYRDAKKWLRENGHLLDV